MITVSIYPAWAEGLDKYDNRICNDIFYVYVISFKSISTLDSHLIPRKSKVKFVTVTEAPISIATTLRCRGGRYSFPTIAPLYPWNVPYIAEC